MQVKFIGDPAETAKGGGLSRTSLEMFGIVFAMGEVVDVSALSGVQRSKLAGNPHFEVVAATDAGVVVDEGDPDPGIEEHKARAAAKKSKKAEG
jgi:hypothetical protein